MANLTQAQRINLIENEISVIKETQQQTNVALSQIVMMLQGNTIIPNTQVCNSQPQVVKPQPKELELTDEQIAIVKKHKPTHKLGTDKGSIHKCVRDCAYEFCGGKSNYNEKLYTLGKKAWFKEYNKEFRAKLKD